MARDFVQTRADPDTIEALEEYADNREISRSEAIRRLLRAGLATEGYGVASTDGGQLVDRLEAIKNRQTEHRSADRAQTAALLAAVGYVVATTTLRLDGLLWAAVGVAAVAALIAATYYREVVR